MTVQHAITAVWDEVHTAVAAAGYPVMRTAPNVVGEATVGLLPGKPAYRWVSISAKIDVHIDVVVAVPLTWSLERLVIAAAEVNDTLFVSQIGRAAQPEGPFVSETTASLIIPVFRSKDVTDV